MSEYRNHLENYLQGLNIATEVVYDVAGKELPVDKRVNSWAVDKYDILDLPEFDFNMDIQPQIDIELQADIIFCLELMEYIYDPVICIKNLWQLLKTDGILYITFPTLYPVHNPVESDYLRYTLVGAIKLLHENGFDIEEVTPRKMKQPELYNTHVKAEGYKVRGALKTGTLFDAGYIIKCKKI